MQARQGARGRAFVYINLAPTIHIQVGIHTLSEAARARALGRLNRQTLWMSHESGPTAEETQRYGDPWVSPRSASRPYDRREPSAHTRRGSWACARGWPDTASVRGGPRVSRRRDILFENTGCM